MTAMGEVWGRMALRLANADAYRMDFALYAGRVEGFIEAIAAQERAATELNGALATARVAVRAWRDVADSLGRDLATLVAADPSEDRTRRLREVNEAMRGLEQRLLDPRGIPGRPWFKHLLYAQKYTYAAMTLPGVQEAIDAGDWVRARVQLDLVAERIRAAAAETSRARTRLAR
jgi:N-acetylated-alpha-linked acidic dipeptidase